MTMLFTSMPTNFSSGSLLAIAAFNAALDINPRYLKAYMRPGDFIVPVNLVGGSDIAEGWRLRPAKLGISNACFISWYSF